MKHIVHGYESCLPVYPPEEGRQIDALSQRFLGSFSHPKVLLRECRIRREINVSEKLVILA